MAQALCVSTADSCARKALNNLPSPRFPAESQQGEISASAPEPQMGIENCLESHNISKCFSMQCLLWCDGPLPAAVNNMHCCDRASDSPPDPGMRTSYPWLLVVWIPARHESRRVTVNDGLARSCSLLGRTGVSLACQHMQWTTLDYSFHRCTSVPLITSLFTM
jgi:hypothetical protein